LSERGAAAAVAAEAWRPERTRRRGAGNERTEQRRDGGFMSAAVAESESGNAGDLVLWAAAACVCVCACVCRKWAARVASKAETLERGKKRGENRGKNTEKRIVAMAHFHTTGASLIVNVRN
jgi:hypothetical protein